ncbi:MAG TPA: DUF4173 domain-containing protein [Mobilitalea sp.]|nr:DUF4173 domain-containing protein [Mobilitalea sp.]
MEQFNMNLPEHSQEEIRPADVVAFERKPESPLLTKVRQNFGLYGGISFIFGAFFAILFYKAGIGLNILLFTLIIVALLTVIMKKLSIPVKSGTNYYYAGAILLALSTTLTASGILQFINFIGILLLLDLSLLHQFYEDRLWEFMKHLLRMIGLPFYCLASVYMPFVDCINFMKHTKVFKNDKTRNIFLGVVISIPFLWMVTALLASADLLFGKLTKKLFDVIFSADIFGIAFMILFGFFACYCIICASVARVGMAEKQSGAKADSSIAITFMTILSLVYLLFCGIQVAYLFAKGLFVLPAEFTYAEYARRGFFELLAVAIMNVSLILICKAFFQESKLLRVIVTVMTVCTYIMIVSATYRMLLYIGAYHLTFLRLFVLLSLLIIALVLTGVIASEYVQGFPLFQYCVAVVSICYIAFSFSKPDYFIAEYLIDHTVLLDREDMTYLTYELSLDAAPAVHPILADSNRWTNGNLSDENNYDREINSYDGQTPEFIANDYYQRIASVYSDREIRDFNYAVYLANQTMKQHLSEK